VRWTLAISAPEPAVDAGEAPALSPTQVYRRWGQFQRLHASPRANRKRGALSRGREIDAADRVFRPVEVASLLPASWERNEKRREARKD